MATWNPGQYLKFASERTQPSVDLASKIRIAAPRNVLDVGCGPGNSTRVLRERWPNARIVGLDNSAEMIAQARRDYPEGEWLMADAATFDAPGQYDVVFSNAALQWIGDYESLLPRLMRAVAPGGCLAVQLPDDRESPLRRAALATAGSARWAAAAHCDATVHYRTAEEVYGLVNPLGRVDLWETTYYHVMASHRELIEWYKGSWLRPFLQALPDDRTRAKFEGEVLRKCRRHYPVESDGKVLYPFKRVFFVVYK